MEDEELPPGALSQAADETAMAPSSPFTVREALSTIRANEERSRRAWDQYAQALKQARAGQDPLTRLSSALTAFGKPSTNRSNWVALNRGLEDWQRTGVEADAAKRQQQLELAKMGLERETSLASLSSKYATDLAKGRSGTGVSSAGGVSASGEPYATFKDPVSGRVEIVTGAKRSVFEPGLGAPGGAPAPKAGGAAPASGSAPYRGPDGKWYRLDSFGVPREVYGAETRPATVEEARQFGVTEGAFENGVFKPGAGAVPLSQLRTETTTLQRNLSHMQDMVALAEGLKERAGPLTTGPLGTALSFVPGSAALSFKEDLLKTLGGNIAFDRLQQMRDDSKTGGALGQVAIQELDALRSSLGALNASMNVGDLTRNLDRVIAGYQRAMNAYQAMLDDKQRMLTAPPSASAPQGGAPAGDTIRYDKNGNRIR